jgi:hypothetical protein
MDIKTNIHDMISLKTLYQGGIPTRSQLQIFKGFISLVFCCIFFCLGQPLLLDIDEWFGEARSGNGLNSNNYITT